MKTIEVSDEMYQQLTELATEMTTQDMRCTKMPHMFQVREKIEIAAYSGCGEVAWVDDEGDTLRDEEEIREYIIEYLFENDSECFDEDDVESKKLAQSKVDEMTDLYDLVQFLCDDDVCHRQWREIEVTDSHKYGNTFFTAKACQEHIDKNHYHYTKPDVYLNHAWRNPEMELVSEFLCNLIGKSNHK